MTKTIYLFLAVLTSLFLIAEDVIKERIPTTIEARFSYFWPESEKIRNIYRNGGIDYQLTGTVPVYQGNQFALRGLNFWWAVDYFEREGKSLGLKYKTKIQFEPLTAGIKWVYPKWLIRPFFGLGLKYYFIQVHNHASFVKRYMANNGLGFVAETGFQVFIAKYFMGDIFLAYSFKQFGSPSIHLPNVMSTWLDIGGLNVGGGIGVKF